MPTSSGKPKAGERIEFSMPIPGEDGHYHMSPKRYGTVVKRSTGDYYTLYIKWDDVPGQVLMSVDAAYFVSNGWMKVVTNEKP